MAPNIDILPNFAPNKFASDILLTTVVAFYCIRGIMVVKKPYHTHHPSSHSTLRNPSHFAHDRKTAGKMLHKATYDVRRAHQETNREKN
ncbi:hypothetical protein ROZALSC1DRAFT_30445 [Rozella allomycis CSF55]|uniref:Uncharacterized protein n=1 Tax=Rozella allomycis (strain CSF55) TaxID=988480 RepID=A0A075ANC0_ROZAC|nr:hypothetical protein O9G_000924 [Rozella allomycis CSF55]RKP17787.1 hypothetical protein ROZALSC1DRAFT_30445 [Rozella allomycis CSF55]|eukprot:EPZ31279.1 hypothetical protein O9G_000924 [Rozella allomycis CSF55]